MDGNPFLSQDFDPESLINAILSKSSNITLPYPHIAPLARTSHLRWSVETPMEEQILFYIENLNSNNTVHTSTKATLSLGEKKVQEMESRFTNIPSHIPPPTNETLFKMNQQISILTPILDTKVSITFFHDNSIRRLSGRLSGFDPFFNILLTLPSENIYITGTSVLYIHSTIEQ